MTPRKPVQADAEPEPVQLTIRLQYKDWQRLKMLAAKMSTPKQRATLQSMLVQGLNLLLEHNNERKLSTKL
jgi:hypothetical protein